MNSSKKYRETIEWERLDLFKKIRDIKVNISCKNGHNKGQKWYGPNRNRILRRDGKNTQRNYTKKIFMTQITTMV